MFRGDEPGRSQVRRRRISQRTQQFTATSRVLYRIEHYSSLAGAAVALPTIFISLAIASACLGFPNHFVAGFEVGTSTITLIMVFTIQHTQTREQAATQRKLDELLRATPGAAESLMMLEEAPEQFMHAVEEDQRAVRSELVDDEPDAHVTDGG